MPRAENTQWEFRLSTDGTLFAFYDPGNGPWFVPRTPLEEWKPNPQLEGWNIPQPWMKGRFIGSDRIDGFGFEWIRFLPAPVAAREVLKIVAEWVDGDPSRASAEHLIDRLARKGYILPKCGDDDDE